MKKLAVLFAALLMVPAAFAQENEGFAPTQLAFWRKRKILSNAEMWAS